MCEIYYQKYVSKVKKPEFNSGRLCRSGEMVDEIRGYSSGKDPLILKHTQIRGHDILLIFGETNNVIRVIRCDQEALLPPNQKGVRVLIEHSSKKEKTPDRPTAC